MWELIGLLLVVWVVDAVEQRRLRKGQVREGYER